MNTILIAA